MSDDHPHLPIEHRQTEDDAIEIEGLGETPDAGEGEGGGESKIRMFTTKQAHGEKWDRTPNVTGRGAIHCKVFHCKLREDALDYMEDQINQWLDNHPEYEVKQVTSSIGEMKTKTITEPAMFVTIWV